MADTFDGMRFPVSRSGHKVVIEDPDALGYRLGEDPLLSAMSADEWRAIEQAALAGAAEAS